MSLTLTVCEKSPGGPPPEEYSIELKDERLTVRELIQNIVFQQIYNLNTEMRNSKTAPREEQMLNKRKPAPGNTIDWVPKYEHALKAFESNQVLLLLDDVQVEELDEVVALTPHTRVTFLKLIPLVGG
jgi:hypothetical protein